MTNEGLVIVALTKEQVDEVINLWSDWSTRPIDNFERLQTIANKLLVSINNTEKLKADGYHYALQAISKDIKEGK